MDLPPRRGERGRGMLCVSPEPPFPNMVAPKPMTQPRLTLKNPNFAALESHVRYAASLGLPLVKQGCHADAPGFVVCGTAPSLLEPDNLAEVRRLADAGHIVIALKEAVTLIANAGIRVDYSVAMDPDAKQIEKTPIVPGVTYAIASSCSPALFDYLLNAGAKVEIFHSACGLKDEVQVYVELFGCGDVIVGGYTLGNRGTGLGKYMVGNKKGYVAGVMFGTRASQAESKASEPVEYYAAGVTGKPGNTGPWFTDDGKVDGTPWWTKLDLMASAIDMAKHVKKGLIEMIGDSLARSLAMHPDEFMDRIAKKETTYHHRPTRVMVSNPRALVRAMLWEMDETLPQLTLDEQLAA